MSSKRPFGWKRIPGVYLAAAFVLLGFVLPKLWPGYGLVVGVDGIREPANDYYWLEIRIAESGFLNLAAIRENTWEGSHGHNSFKGYWIPGLLLSILPALIAIVLIAVRLGWPRWFQHAKGKCLVFMTALTAAWLGILVNAAWWWARHVAYEHGNTAGVVFAMALGTALGFALLVNLKGRTQPLPRLWAYWFRMCSMWMLAYLAWVGLALWVQGTLPFLGFVCSVGGALILAISAQQNISGPAKKVWERMVKSEVEMKG